MATDEGRVRVGLALSGGGARGLAQVGVLRVLEREAIPVSVVAGTSIGAIIGAIYALLGDAVETERRVLEALGSSHMRALDLRQVLATSGHDAVDASADPAAPQTRASRVPSSVYATAAAHERQALLEDGPFLRMFEELFQEASFEHTRLPFAAVAVDLDDGAEVVLSSGLIAPAVAASSAIAGFFPPVRIGDRRLIDGGYANPVPVDAARALGADFVIAAHVTDSGLDGGPLATAAEVATRAGEISLLALEREQLRRADVVVPARGLPRHWSDYSHPEEAIEAGARATEPLIGHIRAAIAAHGIDPTGC